MLHIGFFSTVVVAVVGVVVLRTRKFKIAENVLLISLACDDLTKFTEIYSRCC